MVPYICAALCCLSPLACWRMFYPRERAIVAPPAGHYSVPDATFDTRGLV